MLAEAFAPGEQIEVARYRVSEKLDGVRAYWNGTQLITRGGHVIAAPAWFVAGWPSTPLDGELWGGRGTFERTSGIVRSQAASDSEWRTLSYRVFDMPHAGGSFDERSKLLQTIVNRINTSTLVCVEQMRVRNEAELAALLSRIEAAGGEGLMLHRGDSLYVAARSDDLLKYKSFDDAEARVLGYVSGNGKLEGMMGALLVERADGAQFKVGSGFTDVERRSPPPIGSWITYAYNGLTTNGLPRFARFLRVRSDAEIAEQQ